MCVCVYIYIYISKHPPYQASQIRTFQTFPLVSTGSYIGIPGRSQGVHKWVKQTQMGIQAWWG